MTAIETIAADIAPRLGWRPDGASPDKEAALEGKVPA